MRYSAPSFKRVIGFAVAAAAVVVLSSCHKSPAAPKQVAIGNQTVLTTHATIAAVPAATPLTFANAGGVLAPALAGQTFTMTLSNTTAATPTTSIVMANGAQITGNMTFGSCIVTVTSSSVASVPIGTIITISPCSLTIGTSGIEVGTSSTGGLSLTLGSFTSAPVTIPITVNGDGTVTANGTNTGTTTTGNSTG
jgi:hypothetical protein